MAKARTIKLGGRTFMRHPDESTLERDDWMVVQRTAAGLDLVRPLPGETKDQLANRILNQMTGPAAYNLLGGVIVPEGMKAAQWTPALAIETGKHLKQLTDPDEKAIVQNFKLTLLLDFFVSGITSLNASPVSSAGAGVDPNPGTTATATGASSSVVSRPVITREHNGSIDAGP